MILAEGNESGDKQTKHKSLNVSLITALAKAYRWQDQLESGQYRDLEDIARANKVDRSYVGRILQLTSLAPDIVESILDGTEYSELSLRDFRKGIPFLWEEQRRMFGPKRPRKTQRLLATMRLKSDYVRACSHIRLRCSLLHLGVI